MANNRDCTVASFLLLIFLGILCLLMFRSGGSRDGERVKLSPVCHAISSRSPFIFPLRNVTLYQGSSARIDCRIVKSGITIIPYEKIFWTGPKFEAAVQSGISLENTFTKIIQAQKGIQLAGNRTWEDFNCGLARINPVEICTLIFNSVAKEHEGWYTCYTNSTSIGFGGDEEKRASEKKFYLSVV